MRGMGRYTRRLREVVGLSQEQLARRAGVSQGAVSRLEAGRAVNTPLIVVMKINAAMRQALTALDERKAKAIELLYFGGLTHDEIASVMEIGVRTVARDLRFAEAWLLKQLRGAPG